ncbi:uncharacterized protein LOC129956602 isoform X3 [Argiope bruennichi]|uniref:uncharacterized protein LOC129956602 isoform X3 n=1 Tax=Argiope bruennichi TaxID=94029 RepID=UPI002493DAF4|nr:uncharacterized protein LOC129956602 isoform X3 [Argiope bruennichi]
MKSVYPATWLLLLFISWGDSSELKPEDMHDCYFKLLCPLNNIEEFQRLGEECGDERKQFNEFFQLGGEYWLEVCVNAFSERCKKAVKASEIIAEMFERHFANGDCEKIDETDSKKNKKIVYG